MKKPRKKQTPKRPFKKSQKKSLPNPLSSPAASSAPVGKEAPAPAGREAPKQPASLLSIFRGRPAIFRTVEELEARIDEYFTTQVGKFPILMRDDKTGEPIMDKKTGQQQVLTGFGGKIIYDVQCPTVSGLALFLGFCDRGSMYDYRDKPTSHNVSQKLADSFSHTIKKAISHIERFAENNLQKNDKPVGAIFWLKNHGWKDESVQHQKREVIKVKPAGKAEEVEEFEEEEDGGL